MFKTTIKQTLMLGSVVMACGTLVAKPAMLMQHCGTEKVMSEHYAKNPQSLLEARAFDKLTFPRLHNFKQSTEKKASSKKFGTEQDNVKALVANPDYVIPVVFHVYGTSFNGKTVNDALIIDALQKTNEDFQGLAADWGQVISEFSNVKDVLNVEFRLAKIAPNGSATTGIVYHANRAGYGNGSGYDSQIQADAWDNYKYMNVYIQNDLYNDGGTTNSGVAWYPDSYMSNNNLSRVVYNGAYLGNNTSENFRSVLTHEFGHWLNLIHTFQGGCRQSNENSCSSTGDQICDTPQVDNSGLQGTNCLGQMTNWQNFMHYADQYVNFTKQQVNRMINAMNHSARNTLWTQSNLEATGTAGSGTGNQSPTANANGPYSGVAGTSVSFSSAGSSDPDGSISSYQWSFGDGSTSSSANPSHTYSAAGSYTVTLTVTDNQGASRSASTTATITAANTGGSKLTNGVAKTGLSATTGNSLNYYIDVPSGASNLVVTISGGSGDADLYTRSGAAPTDSTYNCRPYKNGNAETCTEASPASGRWYVRLKAYSGFSGVRLVASYSTGTPSNQAPIADVNGPYNGLVNASVNFTSSGSTDSDGSISAYSWNFGDGTSSTQANPSHSYSSEGSYNVSLTVTDNQGATNTATTTATITSSGGSTLPNSCASQGPVDYVQMQNNTPICVTSGTGGNKYFYFYNNGVSQLTISTGHGTGNADLYYSGNTWPSTTQYDQKSTGGSNSESITVVNPSTGWNYVVVRGTHTGVTLMLENQ